jgi:hypothetical protein
MLIEKLNKLYGNICAMIGGNLTPLAPLTMQELKLSQTLDGANMSPYNTTGEFATSLFYVCSYNVFRILNLY